MTLVLVHGGLVTASTWDPVVAAMPGFSCVCLRRRGYGGADDGPYSFEAEYADVAAALGTPRWAAGYSSGGIVALGAAWRHGLDRLALFEPPLPVQGPLLGAHLESALALVAEGDVAGAVRIGLVHGVDLPPPVADAFVADPRAIRYGASWMRELAEIDAMPVGVERYRSVECPVLLVYGTETQRHHRMAVEALADVLPDREVVRLDGEGHLAPITSPQRLAAEFSRFFTPA